LHGPRGLPWTGTQRRRRCLRLCSVSGQDFCAKTRFVFHARHERSGLLDKKLPLFRREFPAFAAIMMGLALRLTGAVTLFTIRYCH